MEQATPSLRGTCAQDRVAPGGRPGFLDLTQAAAKERSSVALPSRPRAALSALLACTALSATLTVSVPCPWAVGRSGLVLAQSPAEPAAAPPPPVTVYLDGWRLDFDVPPQIVDGRTLVPFRLLSEALGCDVDWHEETRRVTGLDPVTGREVVLVIGDTTARVDGEPRTLDVPAMIVDGRTLIPLRFFSEALGAEVGWHQETRTVTVTSPCRPMTVLGYYALGSAERTSWEALFGRPFPETGFGATDIISELACAWFVLDPRTGAVVTDDSYSAQRRPDSWETILDAAAGAGLEAEMMVHWNRTSGGVTDPVIYDFLSSPLAQERALRDILAYVGPFRGVNLDIEGLGQRQSGEDLEATRRKFTSFVELLAEALHRRGKTLSLSLHPLNSWYPGYDWEALGQVADRIVIMAYGYVPVDRPEPLEKVVEAVDLALEVVPKEKLLLGLLLAKDLETGKDIGETPDTLMAKVGLTKRRRLHGVAIWRLNNVGDERWTALRRSVSRPPVLEIVVRSADGAGTERRLDTTGTPPVMRDGRIYVPLTPVLTQAGIGVDWDGEAGRATVDLGSTRVVLTAGAEAGEEPGPAPVVVRGTLYVTVTQLLELLERYSPPPGTPEVTATWDQEGRRLVLTVGTGP